MKTPQLILRDLFWLVLVCAVVVGWWVDHRNTSTVEALIRAKCEALHTDNAALRVKLHWSDGEQVVEFFEEYLKQHGYEVDWHEDGDYANLLITDPSGTLTEYATSRGPGPGSVD